MIDAQDFYIFGFAGLLIWLFIMLFIKKDSISKVIFVSCCFVYSVIVLGIVLCPIPYQIGAAYPVPHNLIPFKTIAGTLAHGVTRTAVFQIVGNILVAVPYGTAAMVIRPKTSILTKVLIAISFPAIVETLQAITGLVINSQYRSFDVDDFFLNAVGVGIGYLVYFVLPKKLKQYFGFAQVVESVNDIKKQPHTAYSSKST